MGKAKEEAQKAYSLKVTENAQQNIDVITGYIAFIRHQPLNAILIGDKIFKTIDSIEKNPLIFRECEEIPTKNKIYRKAVCLSWLIIYEIKDQEIIILGIISSTRKPSWIKRLKYIK
jgi:plasmid stabilization system protein ParE